ncbi:MAG: RNA methyltransferase [Chloroflexaceae bacterium]|nr:RNA methyltransferase [Chloroflexaceae bacterium]
MISSTANPHVKRIRSLNGSSRERRRERLFVLEGVRLVAEALTAGATLQLALYNPEQLDSTAAGQALLAHLAQQPNCYPASERVISVAADTVTPQGVVAVAAWPTAATIAARPSALCLVLDTVQDPGNVGTLLRSAEAAGVGSVWSMQGSADLYSPKVVRSAMGAHFYVPLLADQAWEALAAEAATVTAQGGAVYVATADGDLSYYSAEWRKPAILIVGNEAHGVSTAALQLATHQLTIPMAGRGESLNAAVAGSVMLFEALRQRTAVDQQNGKRQTTV